MRKLTVVASCLTAISFSSVALAAGQAAAPAPQPARSGYTAPATVETSGSVQVQITAPAPEAGKAPVLPAADQAKVQVEVQVNDQGKHQVEVQFENQRPDWAAEFVTRVTERLQANTTDGAAFSGKALEEITANLLSAGEAKDSAEAELKVEAAVEKKRAAGQAGKAELDVLAYLQLKSDKVAEAEVTLRDRVKAAPADLEGYKKLGEVRAKLGLDKGIEAYVGGKEVNFDVRPMVKEGRTLVPVRALTEALGADVSWDATARAVTVKAGSREIRLTIDSKIAVVDGRTVTLEVPATVVSDRTVLPLRFVAEALGLQVQWEAETQTIVVN